jgi:sporulation protein YqfC
VPKEKHKLLNSLFTASVKLACVSSHIEINNNREARIEGCRKILEYGELKIKILLKSTSVVFAGRNLKIKCLTSDALLIEGFIKSVEFFN